jgi:hypothetical protein
MKLFLIAAVIVGLAVIGLAIRILLVKGGRFNKTCSSSFSEDGKKNKCVCSGSADEDEQNCQYYQEHHGAADQPPKSS